jgi:hypothetical protein
MPTDAPWYSSMIPGPTGLRCFGTSAPGTNAGTGMRRRMLFVTGLVVLMCLPAGVKASALHADATADREHGPARLILQGGEQVTLSREVQMACRGLASETEFELLKESIPRFAIALFLFLLMLTFGFAYMLHRTHFTFVRPSR